ncbi:protein of unknown function [Magnetospirillum sp. XM-1]|nr:protein of unknown function [Magnetospirillum sp. XM-1]
MKRHMDVYYAYKIYDMLACNYAHLCRTNVYVVNVYISIYQMI